MNHVKITGLTAMNVRALQECLSESQVTTTTTTATFHTEEPTTALRWVDEVIDSHPDRGHPRASLWAVRRKIVKVGA